MPFQSFGNYEKPLPHISISDWKARLDGLRNVATARTMDATALRSASRTAVSAIRIESNWATVESNDALNDRIYELTSWREIIEKTLHRLESEIKILQQEKTLTDRELDDLGGPIALISEVFSMRDCRLGAELTVDQPYTELRQELSILENNQKQLEECCRNVWKKLTRLEEVCFRIRNELQNNADAINLDTAQRTLDRNSSLTNKLNAQRNPKNSSTYSDWLQAVKSLKQLAENELADTYAIRESLFLCREKARSVLKSQQDRTEYILRKRIFDTQKAINELEWQNGKLQHEMEKAVENMNRLEAVYKEMTVNLKLAETRLENRGQRLGKELCLDYAHSKLILEVDKILEMQRCLTQKLDESKISFNQLASHVMKINVDLDNKKQSLTADTKALDMRKRLKDLASGALNVINASPQTDENMEILHMEEFKN